MTVRFVDTDPRPKETPVTTVTLTIIETIHYGAEFEIEQLNALCIKHGIAPHDPLGETGDLVAWLQDEASAALSKESGLLSQIEHDSGDVQGQNWKWSIRQ